MSMKLQNTGKRTINGEFKPSMVGLFDEATGKKLMRLYPKEVIDLDNLTVSYDQTKVKDFNASEKAAKRKAGRPAKAAAPSTDALVEALKA